MNRSRRGELIPDRVRPALRLLWAPLRALLLALAVTAVIGTAGVLVQTIRDAGYIRETEEDQSRSTILASIDSTLYAVEHGVHFNQLGAAVEFKYPSLDTVVGIPFPVAAYQELADEQGEDESVEDAGSFRIFDYQDAMPGWAFVPFLGLTIIPALFGVYGGFSIARVAAARSPLVAAGWGALVGPVWAGAMVVINAVVNKEILGIGVFGNADGDSVFVMYLLGGAVFGAIGGLIAGQALPSATNAENLEYADARK